MEHKKAKQRTNTCKQARERIDIHQQMQNKSKHLGHIQKQQHKHTEYTQTTTTRDRERERERERDIP